MVKQILWGVKRIPDEDRNDELDRLIPKEARILQELNKFGCDSIVQFKTYKRYDQAKMHRIYMEYCPHGDLHEAINKQRTQRCVGLSTKYLLFC